METKNSLQIFQREVLESFRNLLEEYSMTTSSVLFYGSEGPYLLMMSIQKQQEVFYAFEFKSVDTTQQKTAAAFSDPQFIFDAIKTMNLPAANRSFESLSLITRKIGVGANKDRYELVDYLRKKLKEREQTMVSASA